MASMHLYAGLAASPAVPPPVVQPLPPKELQRRACGGPCNVFAWYGPDGVIYIDARLDPIDSLFARSILAHEIVHHMQHQALGPAADCDEWIRREKEAFAAQGRWLRAHGLKPPSYFGRISFVKCGDGVVLVKPGG
jgi:hypothetical protein